MKTEMYLALMLASAVDCPKMALENDSESGLLAYCKGCNLSQIKMAECWVRVANVFSKKAAVKGNKDGE